MKNIIFLILAAFVFTACSSKEPVTANNTVNKQQVELQTNNTTEESDLDDEFDDEFTSEEKEELFDPLSGYNRVMTSVNDFMYVYALNPVAKGYAYVIPKPVRVGISNVFDNLMFPMRFTNNLLQLKFQNAGEELGRFVVNSTVGIAGIFDPAKSQLGWEEHDEDFGQTLGHYGVGSGFHIVLPLLGPSNLRDMLSIVPDAYIDPISYTGASDIGYKIPNNSLEAMGLSAGKIVNKTSLRLGQYENIKKDALDLYPFLRDIYEQKRKKEIEE